MPLAVFQANGALLEIHVPWLPESIWMVPAERDAAGLVTEGISRGRIWTAAELIQLMAISDLTPEAVRRLSHAKLEFDGDIVAVRGRR